MSKTTRHTVTGKCRWAKVFESNRDMEGFEGNARAYDGQYSIVVELDKANREAFKASKSAGRIKFDDDGVALVTFKRKHKDRFEWASGAPVVEFDTGKSYVLDDEGLIGNGSTVTVEYTVYETKMAPGTRLEKVVIHDLVSYEKAEDTADVPF